MRKISVFALVGVALFTQPAFVFAQGQGNQGQGNQGQGKGSQIERGSEAPGNRNNGSANRPSNQPANAGRNASSARETQGNGQQQHAQSDREQRRSPQAVPQRAVGDVARGSAPGQARQISERAIRSIEGNRYAWRDAGFQGCPPGLQQKNNGCLPPGQARKLSHANDREMRWYRYSDWYRAGTGNDWRYDRGYAYLVDGRTNLITSALPLLGGALFGGNSWPANFRQNQLTPYQASYFGNDRTLEYRQANGAIFAVDPQTQMIRSIAGLITGDNWTVGSRMPVGYDAYNVPYDYRDRYTDNSSSLYRYNDGYVYEVDPTTQIIRSLIELAV